MARYDHAKIETDAQKRWEAERLYELDLGATNPDPYYLLFEFPYPSGDLHTGHWYAYAVTDIFARLKRMQGKQVLFPIGFDSFGLPAENAAMKNGADPAVWTDANMERMRAQIRSMGTSIDWSKEIVTSSPEYYRWTQWLFAKLFEHGLAERKEAPVKWCPKDRTVLANEQVIDGKCERCDTPVEERSLTQWFMRITKYADRLLSDLDALPWREDIKDAQRAWIGKSEGAKITFALEGAPGAIEVFTTRPDTLYGATYLVIAPEHALARELAKTQPAIKAYLETASAKTERERSENKEKSGVLLAGVTGENPVNHEKLPIYVADYVLGSYGTGAVMAVPAHDERDFEFAKKHDLPIRQVVAPVFVDNTNPWREGKQLVPRDATISILHDPKTDRYLTLTWLKQGWRTFVSGGIDDGEEAVAAGMREIREETGYSDIEFVRVVCRTESRFFAAHKDVNRTARNTVLLFTLKSDTQSPVQAEEKELHTPVWVPRSEIPQLGLQHAEFAFLWARVAEDAPYGGDGQLIESGPFEGRSNTNAMWDIVALANGERTTNYRIRDWLVSRQRYWGCPIPVVYDPKGKPHLVPDEHLPWLLPTDVDFSGKEGTGSPLSTSKELNERVVRIFGDGWTPEYDTLDTFVDSSWYFTRYLAPKDSAHFSNAKLMKKWLPVDRYSGGSEHTTMHLLYARFFYKALHDLALVPTPEPFGERFNRGLIMGTDGQKMSKRWGNVVNPDEMVKTYGADALRAYLAFIGPYNEPGSYPWNLDGIIAMRKFLERVATLSKSVTDDETTDDEKRVIAKATHKVVTDSERFKFNTALSALMIALNELSALSKVSRPVYQDYLRLLAPFAPHLAEHLWTGVGGEGSIHASLLPTVDERLLTSDVVTIAVQVAGKKKGEITLSPHATEADALSAAKELPALAVLWSSGASPRVIYVPGRILNLVPESS